MSAKRRTVPFSISILTLMVLIFLPLSSVLLWLGWRAVEFQERNNVEQRMTALHDAVAGFTVASIRVIIATGETLAETPVFRQATGHELDEERRRELMALMTRHPNLAAAFVAYPDAHLIYVGRVSTLSPGDSKALKVPPTATFLMRDIDGVGAARRDVWWFDDPSMPDAVQSKASDFDPRVRPWYRAAEHGGGSALTDAYHFAWSTDAGISAGVPVRGGGAIGFDFTLRTLSQLMDAYKITPNSIVAVATQTSDVAIESQPCAPIAKECFESEPEARRMLHRAAVEASDDGGRRIERTVAAGGVDYRLIVQAMPAIYGKVLAVAAAVPLVELTASSHALLLNEAYAAGGALVLAVLAVLLVSLLLSRPLARIADKTERIRQLDFSERVPVTSRITEILKLSDAIERMREGLEVFGLYVSSQLVSEIMRAPAETGLGGTRRELTVMFTDIEGFSRISESIEPELLTSRLSRYFDALGEPIAANRGMIDKYIGDSIMAFWNAPQPDPDHVFHACRAALLVASASRELMEKWNEKGRPPFRTRIGLHTGPAVVGNVGARSRINYTLVGAVANQASRLEGLNKVYGTEILAGGEVAAATADRIVWRHVDRVVAAGTTEALDIHEPLGEMVEARTHEAFLRCWRSARENYEAGRFDAALEGFLSAQALRPDDGPCLAFIKRCRGLMKEGMPDDWDGAWHFDRK